MVNEVVRGLTGLEKYTAYGKVLSWTGKMGTQALKTPPELNPVTMPGWEFWHLDGQFLLKKRSTVDAEISTRQESWKTADSGEPVTTHAEGDQAEVQSSAAGAGMGEPPPQFSGETESPPPPQRRESGGDREAPPHLEEQSEEEIAVVETKGVEPDEKEIKHKARNYRLVYKSDFYKSFGWDEEWRTR